MAFKEVAILSKYGHDHTWALLKKIARNPKCNIDDTTLHEGGHVVGQYNLHYL